jgi:hypothetical protein
MAKRSTKPEDLTAPNPTEKASAKNNLSPVGPHLSLRFEIDVENQDFNSVKAEVMPLIAGPLRNSCEQARQHLTRLCLDDPPSQVTTTDKIVFYIACLISEQSLKGYSTLCEEHIDDIEKLIKLIEAYIDDKSQRRPLNFLMLASPGAGKSHFIECVAKRMKEKKIAANTFNMASMNNSDELIKPLDDARNAKVEDKIPLLFLDEFDASPANFGLLLPLLWDGALSLGQRDLKLSKSIIIMAGSSPLLPETLAHARSMRKEIPLPENTNPKLIDLFSRINGSVVRIPPFSDRESRMDRRVDKVAIAVNLLSRRFDNSLKSVPLGLFRFIANAQFRYDVRSIAHMLNLIPFKASLSTLAIPDLHLPLNSIAELRASSLAYHLVDDNDQAHGIVSLWKQCASATEQMPIRLQMPFGFPTEGIASGLIDYSIASAVNEVIKLNPQNENEPKRT